ncbi:restriction endonuclease subunit S [Enterobacter hormaechei]|uniref:restriction endonuclease subunit S n=2 Tax=Enterobacter cloacae complex TaxID=354276 RepID=UPI00373FF033
MSGLSYLEKLLDGAEVEWRTLDSVGQFLRGKRFVKSDLISEGVPCIHYGEMYTHYGISAEETKSFLDEGVAEKLRVANHGDVIIVAAGETIEDIGNGTAWLGKNDVVFHDACFSFKSELNSKYVSYFLRTNLFKEQIKRGVSSGKISSINAKGLGMAEIPIPCPNNPEKSLAIQSEIVRILDKFTALTAELTAELTMRKKQYNYYRDQLLSFEEGEVEWKTLGEIVKMRAGQHISARNIVDGKEGDFVYPCFGGNGIRGYVKEKSHDGEHLLIGRQGALCGNVQRMKGQFYATEHAVVVSAMQGIDIDWAFHMLTTMNLNQYASKSAQPGLAVGKLQELKLLVPSIERQKYIAKMLDKFDTLTGSITEGLPREIELRQKQYEYYRDLLFSFPKPETASN